jgi:hypothetical protein
MNKAVLLFSRKIQKRRRRRRRRRSFDVSRKRGMFRLPPWLSSHDTFIFYIKIALTDLFIF